MSVKQSAIITGAGQGIGAAIGRKLAARGINILIADLNETTGSKVVQELIDTFGVDAIFVKTDVSNEEDVKNMVQAAVDRWGRLDYACNNAGAPEAMARSEENVPVDTFDRMYAINQRGVWLCQKYECLQMQKQEARTVTLTPSNRTVLSRGSVVNISSVNGITGLGLPGYSAAKAAVQSLTRTGTQFYGPWHIRVNAVSPGAILSDGFPHWLKTLAPDIRAFIENDIIKACPAKRQAYPEEIADTVSWLLSDESTFMNGSNVTCDGGFTATRFSANPDA